MKRIFSIVLTAAMLFALAGCSGSASSAASVSSSASSSASGTTAAENTSASDSELFTDRDLDASYDESECVLIELNGSTATASSDSVQISGSTVTITEEATYLVSGTLDDGMLVVDAPDSAKLQIVLNGVTINSSTCAPIYILEADKVFLTLADGTENTLSSGGTFTAIDDNNIDGVIFSKQDLTLNGSGTLTVTSPAGHGIVCKDDLVITGGSYTVESAAHGLDANDSIRITGQTVLTIVSGKDGLHAENTDDTSLGFVYISGGTFDITAEGDGVSAGSYLQIPDGSFTITAGGGSENGTKESSDSWGNFRGGKGGVSPSAASVTSTESTDDSSTSMKGLKAAGALTITGGTFTIDSADDSVHSNTSVTVEGGTFDIASGDDAFHADETLTITEGTIRVTESYEGLEGLTLDIQGGNITLVSSDDGLNAAGGTDGSGTAGGRDAMFGGQGGMSSSGGVITISGGELYLQASGDGIDLNGSIAISGGTVVVNGPVQGDTSVLDFDSTAVITGGTFIGTGASGMAQTFTSSEQGVISLTAGTQEAGTLITVTDGNGNTLISYAPELSFNLVILSSPDLVAGETYTVTVGTASGEFEAT